MGDNPASADVMSKLRELVAEWREVTRDYSAHDDCADQLEALLPALEQRVSELQEKILRSREVRSER